jgi:LysM repeat protein
VIPGGNPTTIGNPAPVPSGDEDEDIEPGGPGRRINPQPSPKPPGRTKTHTTKVHHRAGKPVFVTVAKWPGASVNGLAQWNTTLSGIARHYHTTIPELLKLNPDIKNQNNIFPGEKIRVS